VRKISPEHPSNVAVLHHKSNEHPYNVGVYIDTCPKCKKHLPHYAIKQLELGYRVYCPTEGCFYPLFTVTTAQKKAPEPIEPPKIREKVPDAPKPPQTQQKAPQIQQKSPQIQQKAPQPSKLSPPPQKGGPPKTSLPPKSSDLKYCPHCQHPLSDTQMKLKQTGKKVMCRKCLELI
jgi:hypothetical protein